MSMKLFPKLDNMPNLKFKPYLIFLTLIENHDQRIINLITLFSSLNKVIRFKLPIYQFLLRLIFKNKVMLL